MPWDELCSLERLMALHARGIQEFGGRIGLIDPGCPEGTLGAAWNAVEYGEVGNSLPHLVFACYLLYYFATKQCFADGNKRIAWASMSEVLASIGLEVGAGTDEAYAFALDVAKGLLSPSQIVQWVSRRLRAIGSPPPQA
ncbi:MAG TPA: Fic family protein [Archangium sp.]|nr:Fic family protein [Archangium sp.]